MRNYSFDKYYEYMQKVTPELIAAEETIRRIKETDEWKRAYNYFHVLYNRKELKENPTSKNGYKIERRDRNDLISLSDIEDILTSEQIEKIKQIKGDHHEKRGANC